MLNPINSLAAGAAGGMLFDSAGSGQSENYIVDLYNLLNVSVEEPQPYGAFHLAMLCGILALTLFLAALMKDARDEGFRRIMLLFWIAMIVTELLDQFVCGTSVTESGMLRYSYRWYTFPFQLCDTGIWMLPLVIFLRDGTIRDSATVYMGLFSLFGGMLVAILPITVFTDMLVTNIHTMIQHGSQVALGIFILVNKRDKLNTENFMRASVVFAFLVLIATVLNDVMYNVLAAYGVDDRFNMFYISPHYNSGLPILSVVYDAVPWGVYIFLYTVGFILIAFLVYAVARRVIGFLEEEELRRTAKRMKAFANEAE